MSDSADLAKRRPHSLSPRALTAVGWIAFVVAGAIFFELAWNVASHAPLVALDARVATWLHRHRSPTLTSLMFAVTHTHSTIGMTAASIVMAIVLARMREWYWMFTLALAMAGGLLLNVAIKHAYERARPHFDDPLVTLDTFSFPSGHTAGATLFYGVLGAFLVSRYFDRRARAAIVTAAILAVSLVAFSRMYLGAHYLSDVLAAASSSTVWLVLCLSSVHALVKRLRSRWR
ncbi:MAG: phosphatase PAP2 family protein [Usitatibacter sp.]